MAIGKVTVPRRPHKDHTFTLDLEKGKPRDYVVAKQPQCKQTKCFCNALLTNSSSCVEKQIYKKAKQFISLIALSSNCLSLFQ